MVEYKIIIERLGQRNLRNILHYIMYTLKEPKIAKQIYTTIKEQILTLGQIPFRHGTVLDQPYAEMGVRKLLVENYTVFYFVDEAKCEVHVLRVLYNRREWQNLF